MKCLDDQVFIVGVPMGHAEISSFFIGLIGYGETKHFDKNGKLIYQEVRPTGIVLRIE